jgi:hypothetical protein
VEPLAAGLAALDQPGVEDMDLDPERHGRPALTVESVPAWGRGQEASSYLSR